MRYWGLPFGAAALLVFGCKSKSPEAVCDYVVELAEKVGAVRGKMIGGVDKAWCVKDVEMLKTELGDRYDDWAKCVLDAKDFEAARKGCDPKDFE